MRREKKTIGRGAYPSNRPALFLFGAVFTALFLVSSLVSPLAAYAANFPGFTHTFSYDSLVGVGGGPSAGDNASLAFNAPLTSTSSILAPPRAYPCTAATFSRASAQYITDFEGETRKVESGSVAVEGSRVVTNLLTYSEDLSNAAWTKQSSD